MAFLPHLHWWEHFSSMPTEGEKMSLLWPAIALSVIQLEHHPGGTLRSEVHLSTKTLTVKVGWPHTDIFIVVRCYCSCCFNKRESTAPIKEKCETNFELAPAQIWGITGHIPKTTSTPIPTCAPHTHHTPSLHPLSIYSIRPFDIRQLWDVHMVVSISQIRKSRTEKAFSNLSTLTQEAKNRAWLVMP